MPRRVNRSRVRRDVRYVAAVRRQADYLSGPNPDWYAGLGELLRTGETADQILPTSERPPVHITDLFPLADFTGAVTAGHVRVQEHPTTRLAIANYTERAAYEQAWTPVTLTCRGLIFDPATGEVVARPFPKFFNHGQPGCARIPLDASVLVADKVDGSLGILYPTPDGWAVATRGSFTSEQARHATAVLRTRYPDFTPPPGMTVLVEIVYPANRIVVDYIGLDDLVLLGQVHIPTGAIGGPETVPYCPLPRTEIFECATFADALAMAPRPNAEGIVVRDRRTGAMLKIKQDDYVELHRIVTGLTARKVWEHLLGGAPPAELIEQLPDEFVPWVEKVAAGILAEVDRRDAEIHAEYDRIRGQLPEGWERRDFAQHAARHVDGWGLFRLLDGRDIRGELLKRADPGPYITPARTFSEDSA